MQIGPLKKVGELNSSYRFSKMIFCAKCLAIFGVTLGLMLVIRPDAQGSAFPFAIMFLWFGISMAFAASVLAFLGYLIGWLFSTFLESNNSANKAWPKVKVTVAAVILMPLICFSLYWFLRGLFTLEVLAVKRHASPSLIHPNDSPLLFWFSIILWGYMGTYAPYEIMKSVFNTYKNQHPSSETH